MQKPSDERLIAYLDGEIEGQECDEIALALDADPGLRDHAARLRESAALLRAAFDEVLHEPLPERLIAAAHGRGKVVSFRTGRLQKFLGDRRWWIGMPVAASLACLVLGTGVGYFAGNEQGTRVAARSADASLDQASWLDSIAGYHKLFVNAGPNDMALADVPADDNDQSRKVTQKLPPDFHLPNLKPWGLDFQGARFLMIGGRPATQLFYKTDNKQLGPLTVVIGSSSKPDMAPAWDHRGDFNELYWSHNGHAYALVGTADTGYLWNIYNDIAWQLDGI